MMYMDNIKIFFPKPLLYFRVETVRHRKTIHDTFDQSAIAHDIIVLLLSLIIRREHDHLMPVRPKPLAQPFNGNRYARDVRFVTVGHHCNFHGIITPFLLYFHE